MSAPSAASGEWTGLTPAEVKDEFNSASVPWWICGGWALDLWLGRQTRHHVDTDVGCLRRDVGVLREELAGWAMFLAAGGELTPLQPEDEVPNHISSLWCRRPTSRTWDVQLMIEESSKSRWIYRRDPRLGRALTDLTWRTASEIPVLKPEIQLLYKSKDVRPRDDADFREVLFTLDPAARDWLAESIAATAPDHPWLPKLQAKPAT